MSSTLLMQQFAGLRRERELVGNMLLAYGELEFVMVDILGAVLKSRTQALRTVFQLRSEASRITVFEAISSPAFEDAGLGGQLKEGLDALNHCKNIRNQYAHCTWAKGKKGTIRFANLERTAQTKGPEARAKVVAQPLTAALLEQQWRYFQYTDHMLLWLNQEFRDKVGKPTGVAGRAPKPKRLSPPKLSSHGEALSRLWMFVGSWRLLGALPRYRFPPDWR